MKVRMLLIIACWLLAFSFSQAQSDPAASRQAASCRVQVSYDKDGKTYFDNGSGTLVAKKQQADGKWAGLVLTCAHISDFAPQHFWGTYRVKTYFPQNNGAANGARIYAMDVENDLMLVLVYVSADTPVMRVADNPIAGTQRCYVSGFANGGQYASNAGSVIGYVEASPPTRLDGTQPRNTDPALRCVKEQLLVQAPGGGPGGSGGGVFNADNELVGVVWGGDKDREIHAAHVDPVCCFLRKRVPGYKWGCECTPCVPTAPILIPEPIQVPIQPEQPVQPPVEIPLPKPVDVDLTPVLNNQTKIMRQIHDLQEQVIAAGEKESTITLHVESGRYISPSYVDVSVLWALQQKTGVDHAVLITDTTAEFWKRMQGEYEAAKEEFPAIVLYDVKSANVRFKSLPQIVLYPVKADGQPEIVKGADAVSRVLQKFARGEFR